MPNVPEKQWDEISCWEAFEWRFDAIAKKFGELLSDNYVVSISDDDIVFNKIDDGNDGMCVYLGVETFCNALSDLQITELI